MPQTSFASKFWGWNLRCFWKSIPFATFPFHHTKLYLVTSVQLKRIELLTKLYELGIIRQQGLQEGGKRGASYRDPVDTGALEDEKTHVKFFCKKAQGYCVSQLPV